MAKLDLGVIVSLSPATSVRKAMEKVHRLGFTTCQFSTWSTELLTRAAARELCRVTGEYGITVTTMWTGYPPPKVWDLVDGPSTIGLVPPQWRAERVKSLKRGVRFAAACGIPSVATHVGFISEDPKDALYKPTVRAVRQVARACEKEGIEFWFETGQETPVTLLRMIQDVGLPNLGINLDPANLILYGKANPIDALDVFGKYVRGVHAKDGLYPTDGRSLGKEVALGKGKVNFPLLIPRLYKLGFRGALTIEREISGPRQTRDINRARKLLEDIVRKLR